MSNTARRTVVAARTASEAHPVQSSLRVQRPRAGACLYASRLLEAGRPEDALRLLGKEPEGAQNSAEFQFLLGRAAFRVGDRAAAQSAFRRALALSSQEAELYQWLARQLLHETPINQDNADQGAGDTRETTSSSPLGERTSR